MKIAELLQIPNLANTNLIAGSAGMEREVFTVNMMDAPDIIPYLKPNELLVTTAYHLKDHPDALLELVEAMAEQNCAGLGIKTKRFVQEVPEKVIETANRLAFPIIELPLEQSLGEIVNHSLHAILNQRANELTYVMETHKQFTNLIMDGKGIPKLLDRLSEMIGFPIVLINQYLKPTSQPNSNSKTLTIIKHLLTEGFSFSTSKTTFLSFSVLFNQQTYSVFPIYTSGKNFGYLAILGEIKGSDHLTTLTIEQAANVISFALMQEHTLKQHERSVRNDFFTHFLEDAFSSQEEITNRAKEFSIQVNKPYICLVGKLDETNTNTSYSRLQQKIDTIFEFIEEELFDSTISIHFFSKGKLCILLYEGEEVSSDTMDFITELLSELQTKISTHFETTISFGVSNFSQNFFHIKNAFIEAKSALKEGSLSRKTQYISFYRTKDIIELLRAIPQEDLKNFYTYTLQGFTTANKEEENILLQTMSVYLETHCQISETAKRLYVHRNTVIYRLEKCEDLLGKSLKDADTTLQIRIALRIKTLLNL